MNTTLTADRTVVACNHIDGTSAITPGALCYVAVGGITGGSPDRLKIVARSRGGRWIETWEKRDRLRDFRQKTLPPTNPRYQDSRIAEADHVSAFLPLA